MRYLLQSVPLVVVETKPEVTEAIQLIEISRDYLVGLLMELARKQMPESEVKRSCEMASYFTHINLQPLHKQLTLRTALNVTFKVN